MFSVSLPFQESSSSHSLKLSIQIRTLRQLQESDRRRQQDMQAILAAVGHPAILPSQPRGASNALGLIGIDEEYTSTTLALPTSSTPNELSAISLNSPVASPAVGQQPTALEDHDSPTAVANSLLQIVSKQNSMDAAADSADLRNLLRKAIAAGSDVAMVETLGVKRNEMAEAVKTLQRALEQVLEGKAVDALREKDGLPDEMPTPRGKNRLVKMVRRLSTHDARETQSLKRSKTSSSSRSSENKSTSSNPSEDVDTLEREFLESGIDALKRMSEGPEAILRLPSWTITKYVPLFHLGRESNPGLDSRSSGHTRLALDSFQTSTAVHGVVARLPLRSSHRPPRETSLSRKLRYGRNFRTLMSWSSTAHQAPAAILPGSVLCLT